MRFVVLGSGTAYPDAERGPAGFLVQSAGRSWLVDGGSGTLQRCARAGIDPRELDGGFVSHRHPDHCADLVPLLFAMHAGNSPRSRDYPLWGGEGLATLVRGLQSVWGHWLDLGGGAVVRVHELSLSHEDVVELDGLRVITRPAPHSGGALHLRFEADGVAVVFSGDTGPSDELVALATGADLLVVECGGSDAAPIPRHLHPSAVAALVRQARPREVWLTHLYPGVDPDEAVRTVAAAGRPVRRADDLDTWGQ
jgi:ribonuclease BN (tRNA processing enzyme)